MYSVFLNHFVVKKTCKQLHDIKIKKLFIYSYFLKMLLVNLGRLKTQEGQW